MTQGKAVFVMVKWVFLRSYNNRLEAELAQGLLEGYDITANVVADDYGGMGPHLLPATGGAKLMVPAEDLARATEFLKDADLDIDDYDDDDDEDEAYDAGGGNEKDDDSENRW